MQRPTQKQWVTRSAAALLALAVAQAARATDNVTISGATLFESFFLSPSSTNDFIDVNSNGISQFNSNGTPFVEQLAPLPTFGDSGGSVTYQAGNPSLTRSPVWNLTYRETGSVNGLLELLQSQSGMANPWIPVGQVSKAFVNASSIISGGVVVNSSSNANSGIPNAITATGVDIAVLDVPSKWGLQAAGTSAWNLKPTQAGYGTNSVVSNTGYGNTLVNRTINNITFNNNTSSPDSHTLFDTPVSVAPINIVANPGVGSDQIKATELQQLFVTGRLPTGENLVALTRSVGSGTRNGAMNSLGMDPSFASGENVGNQATGANITSLGNTYQPGNYDGSGDMENALISSRLGIGYDGSDRAFSKNGTKWGSMKVMMDTQGGTSYVTSSVSSIVDNQDVNTGWRIGGLETFVTVGDPNGSAVNGSYPAISNTDHQMTNTSAAAYIRNITESITAFVGAPTANGTIQMPADQLTTNFVLQSGTKYVQNATDATYWSNNTLFNQDVHDYAIANGNFDAKLVSHATIGAGAVPIRKASAVPYSDGSTTGAYTYYDNTGAAFTVAGNATLNLRNKTAGDFNNTGLRNIDQITEMMTAIQDPVAWGQTHHSGATGAGLGTAAIPEILGDFNGDGNFDSKDVRYFADGLALRSTNGVNNSTDSTFNDIGHMAGNLDRRAGFRAVDDAWTSLIGSGNYFGTVLATPKAYASGDSRGDVAGAINATTPGASPVGANGIINAVDIDYVAHQALGAMGSGTDGSFATILTRATADPLVNVRADLSADINGDLRIDTSDVDELVLGVLGTHYGDSDLNGQVALADLVNLGLHWQAQTGQGWADGDFTGDGKVVLADLVLLGLNWQAGPGSPLMPGGSSTAVPEPASLAILALGGLLSLRRRRKF